MSPRVLWLDLETWSETPITYGTHRYAEDAEILLAALAWDDGPVSVLDFTDDPMTCWSRVQGSIEQADRVVIHNSHFDRTVLRHQGIDLPIEKVDDTMVQALAHSLMGSLGDLCTILGVPQDKAKDLDGKKLIHLFCKPRPANQKLRRATRLTHPEEWARFMSYAGSDIEAMREVRKRLPTWNMTAGERALWELDQRVNDRGVQIDMELANAAVRAAADAQARLAKEIRNVTEDEVASATQRARVLEYLQKNLGFEIEDLKGGTIDALLKDSDLPVEVREVLTIRSQAAATSPAKYKVLQRGVNRDHRLRGTLQFCGAMRTGRWGGRLFQPQNLPRPSIGDLHDEDLQEVIDLGIQAMKLGVEDLVFEGASYPVMEVVTSAVRGSIVAKPGYKLLVADLANIEGRMLSWLAGEEWKLEAFRAYDRGEGPDLYKVTAGTILGKDPYDVTKDERQVHGKVADLACGYQGSVGAFATMGAVYGVVLPEEEALGIVRGWRDRHPATRKFWYGSDDAARAAIGLPGEVFRSGRLAFRRDGAWLRMRLPSGRYLCYPRPRMIGGLTVCEDCCGAGYHLKDDPEVGTLAKVECWECSGAGTVDLGRVQITYEGVDQYTRRWKRLKTYGGKLVENGVQAASRDVFAWWMMRAEEAGYPVVLHVHDELLCEVPDTPEYTVEGLIACLGEGPEWAQGLPLAAAGFETYRYRKE